MPDRLISHQDFGALAGEVLKKGGTFRFQANGGSMRPLIFNNETVELTGVDLDQIRRGDVVLYWFGQDTLLLHRVIQVQNRAGGRVFVIQGDASCWPDGAIPAANVLGKATAVLRGGRWQALDAFPIVFFARMWVLAIPARRLAARILAKIKKLLNLT